MNEQIYIHMYSDSWMREHQSGVFGGGGCQLMQTQEESAAVNISCHAGVSPKQQQQQQQHTYTRARARKGRWGGACTFEKDIEKEAKLVWGSGGKRKRGNSHIIKFT